MRRKKLTEIAERIERDIHEIREALRRPLEAEYAQGKLTGPQRSVVRAVFHSDGLSLKELSSRVGLSHSTVSGIVDRLAARGMLERRVNGADRRFTTVAVTQAVRDFMRDKAPRLITQPLVKALATAKPDEREAIVRGLEILKGVMKVDGR